MRNQANEASKKAEEARSPMQFQKRYGGSKKKQVSLQINFPSGFGSFPKIENLRTSIENCYLSQSQPCAPHFFQ